jgi:signal transduction histidine kinase
MRLPRSLRVRLTLAFLLVAALAVAAAAAALVLLVEQATLGTMDAMLLEEATTVARLADLPDERLAAAVRAIGAETDLGPGKFVRVVDAQRTTLASAGRFPRIVRRQRPPLGDEARVVTAGEDERRFRVAWAQTRAHGAVAVGVHAAPGVRFVQRMRWGIALLGAALLAVLGASAFAIAGVATKELDRLASEVATLEVGSLERRLSERRTEEVDRLVRVLNRVFERLERSVGQLQRFTADAAHELRTPLAALRVRLEVALRRESDAVPRSVVIDALEETERLGRLAEDLLMLARVEGGAVADAALNGVVHVTELVEEVGAAVVPLAEEEGRLFHWQAAGGLRVRGSEPLLKRVLLNLVDNAFRHTPTGTAVELEAGHESGRVVFEVRDEGPGIDPEVLPHVFERFRHSSGNGTGLGLALVREIVERHRGTVVIEDRPSGGACARVTLPDGAASEAAFTCAGAGSGLR